MTDKFDINSLSKEQQGSPASYKQCNALAIIDRLKKLFTTFFVVRLHFFLLSIHLPL